MRSCRRPASALLRLEGGELLASRSAWLYVAAMGPLVGHAFSTAAAAYAEASGAGGGPTALPQALSPLDGILVPTLGADDLALMLLYPFVAIRLVAEEKRTGAARLMAQGPLPLGARLAAKLAIAAALWLLAMAPALLAVVLCWTSGGHVHGPELANLLLGHALRFLLATSIAFAAAAASDGAASAAIVTLAFTVGTWAIDFLGAGRGGVLGAAARYTPAAALRAFERGELSWAAAGVLVIVALGALAVAREWMIPFRPPSRKALRSSAILAVVAVAAAAVSRLPPGPDLSEDRRNSFSRADETALARIDAPLFVTVRLAPEDPRLFDLERGVLSKLRRSLRHVDIRYAPPAASSTGLFAAPGSGYGENEYRVNGRAAVSRSTSAPIVLAEIYRLAGVPAPAPGGGDPAYPGYPLRAEPTGVAAIFFGGWPLAAGLAFVLQRRGRWRPSCVPSPLPVSPSA